MSLLLDLGDLPDECCSDALEAFAKASSFGEVSHLWDKVPNRWASPVVEVVSGRLSAILAKMREVLERVLGGHPEDLMKAEVPWLRWDEATFELVRHRLASKQPAAMMIADYELLIEWLINRYLPAGVIDTEAQFLAVRSALMGKIQSNLEIDQRVTDPMIDHIFNQLPTNFAHVPPKALSPLEAAMMDYGRSHAGEAIRNITSQVRHKMAMLCMRHVQAGILGQREGTTGHLATALFDQFSAQNRDFRRVAITEVGEIHNQAYVMARPVGSRVKRVEHYRGACDFCRSINGLEFEVVSPDATDKDGDTQIWAGKTNEGRSVSPMKRDGDRLVERGPNEMWWAASGLMHPNCRGAWIPVTNRPPEVSEEFFNMLNGMLDKT